MANNQLLASDNFASGSLAAGWSPFFGRSKGQVVVGTPNVVEPNTTGVSAGQIWAGLVWPNDQTSEVTANAVTGNSDFISLVVRWQTGSTSGYDADIFLNGATATVQLFVYNSGTPTQLGSTVTGLTFTAGDVWTLQAAGACISIYQNGNRVVYFFDSTYNSGFPGFNQFASTAISGTQVSSWRGYSIQQQDGVWSKTKIVLPALASDLSSNGFGVFNPSKIFFEGTAQILSGSVYKIWFSTGGATTGGICYAESSDGINWSRYPSNVISGFINPGVIKNGSTYYLYCQPASASATGNVALYTSTDGINWAQQSTAILSRGAGGDWDNLFFFFFPVVIQNGTWYALYSGGNAASTHQLPMGLATSPDGINWTKYAGNPISSIMGNSNAFSQINGTWYLWGEQNPPSKNDGTECVRFKSTDLINWSLDTHSVHHSQIFEGVNGFLGQCIPGAIFTVGNQSLFLLTSAAGDNIAPQIYQISLATAPAVLSSLIKFPEDGVAQVAADAWTSGVGNLSSNWTKPTAYPHVLQISGSGLVQASTINSSCAAVYTSSNFSANQYSETVLTTLSTSSDFFNLIVRGSLVALTGYEADFTGPLATATVTLQKRVAGVATQIGPLANLVVTSGDKFRLQVVNGSDGFPVLSLFQNGYLMVQWADYSNAIASGQPGFNIFTSVLANTQIGPWAGGNANVIPNYPTNGIPVGIPIPPFQTNAGPGTNNAVILFANGLGIEAHITPQFPDPTNNAPALSEFLGTNPVSPATNSSMNQFARPTTKEAVTSTGVQFRNPA